jgi:hypothetical protein
VPGAVTITDNETRWRFAPDSPWTAGDYFVEVGTELEDVAGNSLRRLFDEDRQAQPAPGTLPDRVRLPLFVR